MQPQTPQSNPYGAPQAPVGDYVAPDSGVLDQARSVPAGHALAWYREAWRLFKVSPGTWIGVWLAFTVIVIVVSIIPVIGGMIVGVATPLLIGGIMIAARGADREGVVRFGDLFAGFSNRAGTLLLIGLLQLIISMVIGILFGIATAAYIGGTLGPGIAQMTAQQILTWQVMGPMLIVGAVFAVVFVPLTNAVWLASCLAALHDMGALDALRKAFSATLRNLLPLLVWVLVGLLLAIVATVPLALGWFVVGPVFLCAIYAQYRDLFAATDQGA